jgi:hypothetical protein
MAHRRRFGIQFTRPPRVAPEPATVERHDRVPVYQLALVFTAHAHVVIDRAAEAERYFLRDQLDRKSAIVPQLIAQGLALADMPARRALYVRARQSLTDCAAILDMLGARKSVEPALLEPARALALALIDKLLELTASPPRVW